MSDPTSNHDGMNDPHRKQEFDTEVKVGFVWLTALGLGLVIAISMIAMWWFSSDLRDRNLAANPTPSPIPESREERLPPGPLLQASPELELIEMNREYDELLGSYGWVDQAGGVAHIPIERAIELIAEGGQLPGPRVLAAASNADIDDDGASEIEEEDLLAPSLDEGTL